MKDLITGGAGFIGSHLAEALLARGDEVYVIDDLSTGSIGNLDAVRANPRLHVTVDSITNEALLAECVDRCDVVYHLAAAVGVKLIVQSPVRTIETNIYGTELVLKHASKKGKKVILASTSEVYGKGSRQRLREDDDLLFGSTSKARWSYGCSKAIDEFLCLSYWREKGLPVVIVRLFNTIGPRQVGHYGMVAPRFVKQALSGGPITVYGDGKQVRCFTYVGDVVAAMIRLTREKKAVGEVFNVGSEQPVTIGQLAQRVRAMVNPKAKVVYVPYEDAYGPGFEDIRTRVPDVSKLRKLIGFRPSLSLDDILRKIAEHLKAHGSSP
ncbi:MAG: NAD-dependent epimerase/dehydratase family protein [Planctomycetes bacterium]|nr:NAD-dependent epimerase/dehydratase family protein [Planctomycetota bacterium]